MEPPDKTENRNVKDIPPVPIKTYQWEDIRREKRRGKYPYTHLLKGPYEEFAKMEADKPQNGEKKRKVRKVKKTSKVDDLPKNVEKSESQEIDKDKLLMEVEQITTEEEEITEIKLKELPKTPVPQLEESSDTVMDEEPVIISESKTDTNEPNIENQDNLTIITETRDLSAERQMDEGKEIETILPDSDKLIVEAEKSKDEELKENADKMSIDTSIGIASKADSRNTESEDTYTESKIEEYLDKDVSKSVSDASGIEGTTSMSDIELPVDKPDALDVADKKRKHSGISEMTKSNLSLYEKLKNTKFKPPTFKIPKFKKFGFSKQGSKRAKTDSKEQTTTRASTDSQTRRKSETPVYIYIPLKPSAEELEQERLTRLKEDNSRRGMQGTSEITNGNNRINDVKDTNGAVTSTAPVIVGVKPKWKSFPSKTDKKSPPVKKKSKPAKKTSPSSEKKSTHKRSSPPVAKRSGDSPPVEYIHIPLNPSKEQLEVEWEAEFKKHVKQAERYEKIMRGEIAPEEEYLVEDTSKGAIKKKPKEKKNQRSYIKIS